MIKKRLNIRMSGLGGQGAVTAAHVLAMAANRDGKFSISNPFFGAEKRMAPGTDSLCQRRLRPGFSPWGPHITFSDFH